MLKIAIVGATGIVGQQAIVSLLGHPWFEISKLVASERSATKKYIDALRNANGSIRWWCPEELPEDIANMVVEEAASFDPTSVDIIFSTMDAGPAKELEPKYAKTTPVISTASAFRYEADTPILVGGVNMDHAALLDVQRKNRGWKGFISPKSNCTIAGLVVSLKPILDHFGVKQVIATSLQAMSGAGRTQGLSIVVPVFNDFAELHLPSSPAHLIDVTDDPFRPQPRMDRDKGGGMTVTVGRIRKDPILENGIKYVCLAHNTKLGAAKGALQTAEYLVKNFLKLV